MVNPPLYLSWQLVVILVDCLQHSPLAMAVILLFTLCITKSPFHLFFFPILLPILLPLFPLISSTLPVLPLQPPIVNPLQAPSLLQRERAELIAEAAADAALGAGHGFVLLCGEDWSEW